MENLVSPTTAGGHVYTPAGGPSLQAQPSVPKGDGKKSPPPPPRAKKPQFRNAVPYLVGDGGVENVGWGQDKTGRNSGELGKDAQSSVRSQLALKVASATPEQGLESQRKSEPDPSIHIQGAPQWSLAAELAAMSPEDTQAMQELMASLGLPDITTGSLPPDFDPSSFPSEIIGIAEMLARQLGPENSDQKLPVPPIQPTPAKVEAEPTAARKGDVSEEETQLVSYQSKTSLEQHATVKAIAGNPPSSTPQNQPPCKPVPTPTTTPKPPPKLQAQTQAQTVFPIPTDLHSLIPPRPRGQVPSYPANQLPTPHNPIYSYDVSLLRHIDPYLFLDPTHPANPLMKTHPARISRFPELPDAQTRQDLNTPKCSSAGHPADSKNAKYTDCARAISNIIVPETSPESHPDFYSYTSTLLLPSLASHVISEFGTCRVLARNANGKAAASELDKVKYLAGRVLRECSEQQGGSWRDRRTRTVGGTIGYLFVNEDIGGWDVVEVALERAVY